MLVLYSSADLQLFAIYDSDGRGELDKDEFVAALGGAGFSEAESLEIFDTVRRGVQYGAPPLYQVVYTCISLT